MAPRYDYRQSVTGTFLDVTSYFRLYELDVTMNAEEGSVGNSTVVADDPNADLDIVGHRQFRITEESATGSNARIWTGYTAERNVRRGDYHRSDAGRIWEIALTDVNVILSRRIFDLARANRPAETDIARLQWLLTQEEAGLIGDSRYLNTTGGVAMDANDYRGQTVADLINDCAQQSGKNWFVWYAGDTGAFSLWYDFASSTSYSSPLRLSNVLSDIDSTWTFGISDDTKLNRDPSRVFSGVYLPYDGGAVFVQSMDTVDAFARRDVAMPSYNVKRASTATNRANRYLLDIATEEDVITTTVVLPAAKVNFLMQGMRVQFKAVHLPGYESYTWLRALNRNVKQISEQYYAVALDLSASDATATSGGGTGAGHVVLYVPVNTHTGAYNRSNQVVFAKSGDNPPAGYPHDPTTGNFTKTPTYTSSSGTVYYAGITCTAAGNVTVSFRGTFAEVFTAGASGGFKIMQNGATIVSDIQTTGPGGYWSPTFNISTTVAVLNGDVLAVQYTGDLTSSGRYPIVPSGAGQTSNKLVADYT